jgi:hypothetical protein
VIILEQSPVNPEENQFAKTVLSDNGMGFEQEHEKNVQNLQTVKF